VQPGDTLWGISAALYGDGGMYKRIQRANTPLAANELTVGQIIELPNVHMIGEGPR
jgi:nucleoid-associated protein YgaU